MRQIIQWAARNHYTAQQISDEESVKPLITQLSETNNKHASNIKPLTEAVP